MAGLYLHIPFCERKCIYCSFYSVETTESKDRFLDALVREIAMRADALEHDGDVVPEYESVFFGGGTPSLLSPDELERIFSALRARFTIRPDAEITMECNPGALTDEWLVGYRDLGVNRLSFGVQSFHDDELKFLSRIHSADETRASITTARGVFDNVSLDLIFALPGQSLDRWQTNLAEALRLGTSHISAYSLIFEEGTKLNAMRLGGTVAPAPEDFEAEMYEETVRVLSANGFAQYEVSNHARPGRACRHNIGYWERRSYVSFGPSAHAFLRRDGGDLRWANVSSLSSYLGAVESGELPVASREILTAELELEEIVLLGLRSGGIILPEIERVTGARLADVAGGEIEKMIASGYARLTDARLSLTSDGYLFADRLALQLIHAIEHALPDLARDRSEAARAVTLPIITIAE